MKHSEQQALSKIATYCSKAERAESDIKRKLQTWEVEEDAIKRIIDYLKKEKFLSEERYCRSFIKDKLQFNRWGKTKIIFELKKKQISASTIERCLEDIDTNEIQNTLDQLLTSKLKTIKATNDYDRKIKLTRFALGRGYSYDQIKKSLSEITNNNNEEYPEFFF